MPFTAEAEALEPNSHSGLDSLVSLLGNATLAADSSPFRFGRRALTASKYWS